MHQQVDGLLLIDKPAGLTSHDVVDVVRKKFKQKKVGHCGTLDPLATGLLMIVLGRATKVQDLLMAEDKEYVGKMKLGERTDTQDADGKVTLAREVGEISKERLRQVFEKFVGDFYQMPPMVSAVKQGGIPLYKLAREGKVVERQPRLVHVYWYKLLEVEIPFVDFELKCSKGFYVRTYCDEIGELLGCGAHLTCLKRTRSGNFSLGKAVSWQEFQTAPAIELLTQQVLSLADISRIRRQ